MFVIHLEHAPDSIRGELSLFSQEIAPFTFVSSASAKTRDYGRTLLILMVSRPF